MIKKAKEFMFKLLKPNSGVSSRRFVAITSSFLIMFIALIDLFTSFSPSDYVYEGLLWLAGICWGAIGMENAGSIFSSKRTTTTTTTNNLEEKPKEYIEPEPPK